MRPSYMSPACIQYSDRAIAMCVDLTKRALCGQHDSAADRYTEEIGSSRDEDL